MYISEQTAALLAWGLVSHALMWVETKRLGSMSKEGIGFVSWKGELG